MSKILVNLFHPDLARSRGNRTLAAALNGLEHVTVRDVYAEYHHELQIDVDLEQALLLEADIVVFQHPFYWYNCPVLMKMYQEKVLTYKWAYPPGKGDALKGKRYRSAITTGGPQEAYRAGGSNHFTVSEFLRQEQQTATLCGMVYLPAFVVHGVLPNAALGGISDAALLQAAQDYRALLTQDAAEPC